jgi:hypothetical protein
MFVNLLAIIIIAVLRKPGHVTERTNNTAQVRGAALNFFTLLLRTTPNSRIIDCASIVGDRLGSKDLAIIDENVTILFTRL